MLSICLFCCNNHGKEQEHNLNKARTVVEGFTLVRLLNDSSVAAQNTNFNSVIHYAQKARAIAKRIDLPLKVAKGYLNQGIGYSLAGKFDC